MGIKENKQMLRRSMDEVWTKGELNSLREFYSDDYVEHNPYGKIEGLEPFGEFISAIRGTYSNFRAVPHNIVADENFVACNYTVEGKHTEKVGDLEPTNNEVRVEGTFLARMENGKVVEAWNNFDLASLLTQLELISVPSFVETREEQIKRKGPEQRAGI